uniref:ATP-dependent DNA helicase n=1 Tax=Caenorhabditis tropicalis TaxID=1561998 RepID=A0A1I7TTP0_9PELO
MNSFRDEIFGICNNRVIGSSHCLPKAVAFGKIETDLKFPMKFFRRDRIPLMDVDLDLDSSDDVKKRVLVPDKLFNHRRANHKTLHTLNI